MSGWRRVNCIVSPGSGGAMQREALGGNLLAFSTARGAGWEYEPYASNKYAPDGLSVGGPADSLWDAMEKADYWAAEQ